MENELIGQATGILDRAMSMAEARGHPRRQLAVAAGLAGRHRHPGAYSTGISL
jgi:hypothetical protein